jgi:hypothetical protein
MIKMNYLFGCLLGGLASMSCASADQYPVTGESQGYSVSSTRLETLLPSDRSYGRHCHRRHHDGRWICHDDEIIILR